MSLKKSVEFRPEAVQFVLASGLSRKQIATALGIRMSSLNKWAAKHKHDDLMSGKRNCYDNAEAIAEAAMSPNMKTFERKLKIN